MASRRSGRRVPSPFIPERLSNDLSAEPPPTWSEESTSRWLFLVHLFSSEIEELDLELSRLRRLEDDDILAMKAAEDRPTLGFSFDLPSGGDWHDFQGREMPWILEIVAPSGEFDKAEWIAHYLRRAAEVTLRLVSDRYYFTSGPIVFQPGVVGSLKGQFALSPRSAFTQLPSCRLSKADAEIVRRIHGAGWDTDDPRVRIALRRFRRGYGSGDDDALIDLWIGLEALFSDGGGEITYKAALRIAHYVGLGRADRKFLFRALKKSYDARSALVHGNHPTTMVPARRVASHSLRCALLRVLLEGTRLDMKDLDDVIAGGPTD